MVSLNNHISYIEAIRKQVSNVVVGQDEVNGTITDCSITSGHILLQGMPGLAKTLLVNALGKAIHLDFSEFNLLLIYYHQTYSAQKFLINRLIHS